MENNTPQATAETKVQIPDEMEKVIKTLSKEKQAVLVAGITQIQSFSGPIPPPEIMQGYENLLPGSANRILTMAENQSAHRIDMEKSIVKRSLNQKTFGLIMGDVLALVILGVVVYFAILGLVWLAGVLATTSLLGVLIVLFLGKTPNGKDDQEPEPQKRKKK